MKRESYGVVVLEIWWWRVGRGVVGVDVDDVLSGGRGGSGSSGGCCNGGDGDSGDGDSGGGGCGGGSGGRGGVG